MTRTSLLTIAIATAGLTAFSLACTETSAKSLAKSPAPSAAKFELKNCELPKKATAVEKDSRIRESAQRGLNFLADRTVEWQEQHKCMGCHVQGVTGEALSVGIHHQYEVEPDKMKTVLTGLLDITGGIRTSTGHSSVGGALRPSTRAFAGAAIARYDEWVKNDLSDDLLTAAHDLVEAQGPEGSITQAYSAGHVSRGPIQGTYQAIQTWQQAYARSADDRWLTAISSGERYLQNVVDGWYQNPPTDVQALNYALLGLLEAGVGPDEQIAKDLRDRILWLQNEDGGWGLGQQLGNNYTVSPKVEGAQNPKGSGESNALSTGQALYALRTLGMTDERKVVKTGTKWLIEHQTDSGGWSATGAASGEAMWAVLGLVSTDVLSIDVAGLKSGQHVGSTHQLAIKTKDNGGTGVLKVEVMVDDIAVAGACSDTMNFAWDASGLDDGLHTLEVVATNKAGQTSKRRFIVYGGDTYLTNIGTKFEADGTKISYRDIAPTKMQRDVMVEIYATQEKGGVTVRGSKVFTQRVKGKQGAASYNWQGKNDGGKELGTGDYIAVLKFKDGKGGVRQTVETPFVHASRDDQRKGWGDVAGNIDFGAENVQGAMVELVDEKGNVVQQVRSTKSGAYRFKNAKAKRKYKVRVRRQGFKDLEKSVAPVAAAEEADAAPADFTLSVE